jgi:hypothetical protein
MFHCFLLRCGDQRCNPAAPSWASRHAFPETAALDGSPCQRSQGPNRTGHANLAAAACLDVSMRPWATGAPSTTLWELCTPLATPFCPAWGGAKMIGMEVAGNQPW